MKRRHTWRPPDQPDAERRPLPDGPFEAVDDLVTLRDRHPETDRALDQLVRVLSECEREEK